MSRCPMTTPRKNDDDDNDGLGCWLLVGIILVGLSAGSMWGAAAGWFVAGIGILTCVALMIIKGGE